ncbi:MAG: hypothetical protein V4475_12455 [Pseudomonadota bacterium]
MTREGAVRLLFMQWAITGAIGVLLITAQSIGGKYGEDSELAWNWLLGQFTPALSILTAAAFADPSARWRKAASSMWKLRSAVILGVIQAICMLVLLLLEPLLDVTPFDLFGRTQWMLALLQGIAVAAIGSVIFDGR